MSDNHDYLRTGDRSFRLSADVMALMLKGAGYAAILCLVVWLCFYLLYVLGLTLPERSRETEDPTPFSQYIAPLTAETAAA